MFNKALAINPPFQQKVFYFPDEPYAWAWKLNVEAGRRVEFDCLAVDTSHRLFVDLYSFGVDGVRHIKSATDNGLSYEADENITLLLRLQPEMLIGGQATLQVKDYPTLGFPVQGGQHDDIGSFWGDSRDGGIRQHEGVDIFAKRGTPVVAASDGRISRIGDGGLGGKKIWLRSGNKSQYYAHLDSIDVHAGQSVVTGDTIGFVGNTGNARTTPPHLHFGIYIRGAVNPLPFIESSRTKLPPLGVANDHIDRWGRIGSTLANVRPDASTDMPPITSLRKNDAVVIRGVVNGWYEVTLPGDTLGFIYHNLVTTPLSSLSDELIKEGGHIVYPMESARQLYPFDYSMDLKSYGSFGRYTLARFQDHWVGVGATGID